MSRRRRVDAVFDDDWVRYDILTNVGRKTARRRDQPSREVRIYVQLFVLLQQSIDVSTRNFSPIGYLFYLSH